MKRDQDGELSGYETVSEDIWSDGDDDLHRRYGEGNRISYPYYNDYSLLSRSSQSTHTDTLLSTYAANTLSNYRFGDDLYRALIGFVLADDIGHMEMTERRRYVLTMMNAAAEKASANELRIKEMIRDVKL